MKDQDNRPSEVQVELKYCERCGGLWFRECGSERVYCDRCLPALGELPAAFQRLHIVRLPSPRIPGEDDEEHDVHDIDAMQWPAAGGVA